MKKYRIGTTTFEADDLLGAIAFVKANNLGGRLVEVKGNQPKAPANITDGDKKFTVTCGWGSASHKWETTKAEAIQFRNTCPEHRNS